MGIAAITTTGELTATTEGRTVVRARAGGATVTQPIVVSSNGPVTWVGTYLRTSCASDCAPCCSYAMKGSNQPSAFGLELNTDGSVVTAVITLAPGTFNPSSAVAEGFVRGDLIQLTQSSVLVDTILSANVGVSVCCAWFRDFVISRTQPSGSFVRMSADPRRPLTSGLTLTNTITSVSR
jgi:hypothetical protein